ncbi:DUF397 domain-containing protein [Streptomyces sp. NPDC058301]|uniref:DUF397 domain-containing protein n=1 Tax=Streptomyces sp. NPDC058301 TaxID=3346436 RepID=UPI0036EC9515
MEAIRNRRTDGWYKSSYSGEDNSNCLEVADLGPTVGVRDSKDIGRPAVTVPRAAWVIFVRSICLP